MAGSNKKILSSIKKRSLLKSKKKLNDSKSKQIPMEKPSSKLKESFDKLPKINLMYVFLIIILVIILSVVGVFLTGFVVKKWKGEKFNANDTGVPMTAIKNPKDHDIQAQNRCHGLGCGNFEIDVWNRVDPEEHHLINDSLIIDEQEATKFRKLQVPLVPSTDPAGGTLDFIGKDPIDYLNKNISFNPQHVSVSKANKNIRKEVGNDNFEDKYDRKPVKLTNKFQKTVANDFSDDFDNIMPGLEMFKGRKKNKHY